MHFDQWKRREFITMLGGAAASPLAARAQQATIPVIGWLSPSSLESATKSGSLVIVREGLAKAGYVEGTNIKFEFRFAQSQYDRLPALALDLVARKVAVILAFNTAGALAAKQSTPSSNRVCWRRRRSGQPWSRRKPQPSGWQRNGCEHPYGDARGEAVAAFARSGPHGYDGRRSHQSQ
jgi:hypothetical protein